MSSRRVSSLLPLILLVAVALPLPSAAAIYVDCSNTSGQEDGTWEHPYRLISGGMAAAVFGDTVAVLPGFYSESHSVDMHDSMGMNCAAVTMKDGVVLQSTSGVDSTTIEGLGVEAAVYFDGCGSETALIGFTIFTDYTGWGLRTSVLCYNSSPLIDSNVMLQWFDGVYCRQQSSPVIRGNEVGDGGIVFTSGSGGTVVGNDVESGISFCSSSTPSVPLTIESNTIGVLSGSLNGGRPTSGIFIARGGPGEVTILDNTIQGKGVGAILCRGALHGNRFTGNTVNIEIGGVAYCSPWEDIDAEANWWGTTDPLEIDAKIIDCYDDPALESCVDFDPWCLDEACTQTAVGEFSWGAIKALYR
ncbi:right-handed parallel beta-helix repeat-containing protein [bacterium]|nr:right-handed parallel beta-helix repeat-containing protein [bacterium]